MKRLKFKWLQWRARRRVYWMDRKADSVDCGVAILAEISPTYARKQLELNQIMIQIVDMIDLYPELDPTK